MSVEYLQNSPPQALQCLMSQRSLVIANDKSREERWLIPGGKTGTYIYLHLLVQAIVHDEAVCHAYPMGFHGMPRDIGIIAHIGVIEVGHLFLIMDLDDRINGRKACHD